MKCTPLRKTSTLICMIYFFFKKVSLTFKHVKYEKVYKNENVQSTVILFFIFTNKYLA